MTFLWAWPYAQPGLETQDRLYDNQENWPENSDSVSLYYIEVKKKKKKKV